MQTTSKGLHRTEATATLPAPEPRPQERRDRQLVLLAEDNPHDLRLYGTVLFYNGFDVLEAGDGETAVALAEQHSPDLVLLDLLLPELTGIEACRRILQSGCTAPVLALTARSRLEFGDVAREAGFRDYLEKPISPLNVLHRVEELVGRPPAPGEEEAGQHDVAAPAEESWQ